MLVATVEEEQKRKIYSFIVFAQFSYSGRPRTIIIPGGPKANGWFGVTKLLKETLTWRSNFVSNPKEASTIERYHTSGPASYANVVRGDAGGLHSQQLKPWRSRACGSWDIYAAALGDVLVSTSKAYRKKVHEPGLPSKTSREAGTGQPFSGLRCADKGSWLCSSPSPKVTWDRMQVHSPSKLVGASSPGANQFQALRDLLENYPDSDSCSSVSDSPCYHSFVPESTPSDVRLPGPSPHNQVRDLIVYSHRKNLRKGKATFQEGNDSLRRSDYVTASKEGVEPSGQEVHASDKAPLSNDGHDHNFDRGSGWVMDHIIPMCKRMGLGIEGREMELLAFLASLEPTRKRGVMWAIS